MDPGKPLCTEGMGGSAVLMHGGLHVDTEEQQLLGITKDSMMSLTFESLDEAQQFYKKYARVNGFGIRMDDIYKNRHGEALSRRMVCSAEGKRDEKHIENPMRQREHRSLTRTGCKAGLRVRKNKDSGKWEVYFFEDDHNHDIYGPKHTSLHRCHRTLTKADVNQVDTMQSYGIRGSYIYGYIAGQSGGYDRAGFTRKDMFNHINRVRAANTSDGDAMAALHYLRGKADTDPDFMMKYNVDNEGRLQHLFWSDGSSRLDYQCFGEVLAFDTTYKKNKYNWPLVIFSGVNHHRNTVVFGSALVADETEETYKWVLMTLLEAMDGKQPISIITDSDKAMRNAIKCILPMAHHRLCAWHLERNATSNVGSNEFTKAFKDSMFADVDVPQFEDKWRHMVEEFGVEDNVWVQKMYRKRTMWAAAYLRGNRFVGLRTTSLCEGMNAYIKRYVSHSQNLVEFLHHFQRALSYLRYNECVADFKSMHGQPVLTTGLESIERSGANIYTREAFWLFRREIKLAGGCVVCSCKQQVTTRTYRLKRFMSPEKFWDVHIDKQDDIRLSCACRKLQSFGIPCQHIIFVMVQEDIDCLPPCLIESRWTKNAKEVGLQKVDIDDHGEKLAGLRFGSLIQDCRFMCNLASRSDSTFHTARDTIQSMSKAFEDQLHAEAGSQSRQTASQQRVLDPRVIRSKGRPSGATPSTKKRKKRCAICRVEGHTRVTCPTTRLHNSSGLEAGADSNMGARKGTQLSQEVPPAVDTCFFDALMVS